MTDSEKMDLILQSMSGMREDISGMKGEISEIKEEISGIKEEISGMKADISRMDAEMALLTKKVTNIEITLENETNRNIQIIAEGHFSLDRKLDEALRASHDNDLYKMKVNMLDAEIRKIAQGRL